MYVSFTGNFTGVLDIDNKFSIKIGRRTNKSMKELSFRTRPHEQAFFAKVLHAVCISVSVCAVIRNKCHIFNGDI